MLCYVKKQIANADSFEALAAGVYGSVVKVPGSTVWSDAFHSVSTINKVIGLSIKTINLEAFRSCTGLSAASFPIATWIGAGAFSSCTSLRTVTIPMCEHIEHHAFYSCNRIKSLELNACNYIGSYAFAGCENLTAIKLGASSVVTLDSTFTFNLVPIKSIYVPASLVDSYKNDTKWSSLSTKIIPL